MVDYIFKTSAGQRNIRFESRSTYARTGQHSFEIAGSSPDVPTLSLGDNYAAFGKPLYIAKIPASKPSNQPYPNPTALLQLGKGSADTAALKFTSGTLLTTTQAGAIEFNNNSYYATITTGAGTAAARGTFDLNMPSISLSDANNTITPTGSQIYTMSPTNDRTITFSGTGANVGSRVYIFLLQTTTTSRTITFAGNSIEQGTLSTGTTNPSRFVVSFVFDGTYWTEVSRTVAMQ